MNLLHTNDSPGKYPPSLYSAVTPPLPPCAPLTGSVRADVCIIGGGYTGLSAALHLAQRGYDVRLIEAQRLGFGASGRNGGQVGSGQRNDQAVLEAQLGHDDARRLWDLAEEAKALVRALAAGQTRACDWRDGVAHVARRSRDVQHAQAEARHLAQRYGYEATTALDRDAAVAATGSDIFAGGVLDHGAGHLNPLAYAFALAEAAQAAGAHLHERSEAVRLEPGPRPSVTTQTGRIEADHVILACNGYLGDLHPGTARRGMPINNFIVATEPLTDHPEILPKAIAVADDKFVVNYWRKSAGGRLVFGGGESYGYRFPADIAAKVRPLMAKIYPQLAQARIDYAWGGTLAITRSRLPYFARPMPGFYTASGYSGHGVAMATLAGRLMAEAVAGDAERFDLMARLPTPRFPGGPGARQPLLALAMTWFALRDRLGL
jgi:gamma-glutamylputrescine oxidase